MNRFLVIVAAVFLMAQTPPYPDSTVITAVSYDWNSLETAAPGSDNWPMTWAADGDQYTTFGDGGGCQPRSRVA